MTKIISYIIVILFCWIIYPYKWIVKFKFNKTKALAIKRAKAYRKTVCSPVFVVQIGKKFLHGTKIDLRNTNRQVKRLLGTKDYKLWDYRTAIIHTIK